MQPGSKPASADARGVFSSFHQQGIPHFALGVASVDAAYAWALGEGLEVIMAPQVNETMGVKYCFIADPDGTQIEFLERI
jgi:catechol 2,3-dioxygenase-like lactoylglutathione lyase family enzyme